MAIVFPETITPDQIKRLLRYLDEYEMSILRNSRDGIDDPEAENRELIRILEVRSSLRAARASATPEGK